MLNNVANNSTGKFDTRTAPLVRWFCGLQLRLIEYTHAIDDVDVGKRLSRTVTNDIVLVGKIDWYVQMPIARYRHRRRLRINWCMQYCRKLVIHFFPLRWTKKWENNQVRKENENARQSESSDWRHRSRHRSMERDPMALSKRLSAMWSNVQIIWIRTYWLWHVFNVICRQLPLPNSTLEQNTMRT